jgi:hypothetical protein
MEKLKKHPSDECWWCEEGKRQTREHLFKECSRWRKEIKELWRRVAEDVGWRRAKWKPISALFGRRRRQERCWTFSGAREWARCMGKRCWMRSRPELERRVMSRKDGAVLGGWCRS